MLVGTLLPRYRVLQLCSVCVVTGFLMVGVRYQAKMLRWQRPRIGVAHQSRVGGAIW